MLYFKCRLGDIKPYTIGRCRDLKAATMPTLILKSAYFLCIIRLQLSADQFFDKALNKSLTENDFDFTKKGQTEKMVKGSVRRKVRFLSSLDKIFDKSTLVEESFNKNQVSCTFAVSENSFTLGFIALPKCRPNTLLKGNELKNPQAIDSIKRRKKGESEFVDFLYEY